VGLTAVNAILRPGRTFLALAGAEGAIGDEAPASYGKNIVKFPLDLNQYNPK
jgi:hypothetical protein